MLFASPLTEVGEHRSVIVDLLKFQLGVLHSPVKTLRRFAACSRRLRYGLTTVLLFASLYTAGVIAAYSSGHLPYGVPLLLRIPIEDYYFYESFFLLPITLATWVTFAGSVQLIALGFGGRGTFEDMLAASGLPFIVLIVFMFLPDLVVDYALPASVRTQWLFVQVINPARLVAASVWLLLLHGVAVSTVQQVSICKAAVITLLAYVPYLGITMTYMR